MVISSLMVVTVQNSVYSVLFLVLSFICASVILFLLECEFIRLTIVQVGISGVQIVGTLLQECIVPYLLLFLNLVLIFCGQEYIVVELYPSGVRLNK